MKCAMSILIALLASSAAQAASIHYRFEGSVTALADSLLPDFALRESIVITLTIDDTDLTPDIPDFGRYPASDLTLTIGGDYTVVGTVGGSGVGNLVDDLWWTEFAQGDVIGPRVAAGRPQAVSIMLNFRRTAFDSEALPVSIPPLHLLYWDTSSVDFAGDVESELRFQIGSITIVPEPGTGLLLLSGLLGLAAAGRRS